MSVPDEGYSRNVFLPDEGLFVSVPDEGYSSQTCCYERT